MPLESTIICVDNSEYMRNGDYIPNRLQAQQDAVNTLCRYKLLANPENNVGLLTLAKTEVLATLTTDGGKILTSLHKMQPQGFINLLTGIRIAHLALKHRQSKNHKMRIIVFVGSPVSSEEKDVIKIGKRLKKENVNVDVVNFGETEENQKVLESFVNTINGREGTASHLVTIPPSPHLANALMSSPIIVQGEDGSGAATSFSGGGGFDFGVDPNEDPELALALRVSMEEQRQRQQEEERRSAPATAEGEATAAPAEKMEDVEGAEDTAAKTPAPAGEGGASEEEMLQQALAMSMEGGAPAAAAVAAAPPKAASATKAPAGGGFPDFSAMTEEEQIAYAMQISMQGSSDTSKEEPMEVDAKADQEAPPDFSQVMSDPAFLHDVLQSLPGVDAQSSALRQAVGSLATKKEEGDAKKEEEEQKKKDKK